MSDRVELISGPTGPYAHGYLMCRVRYHDGRYKMVGYHKYVYERAYGVLPKGISVHHINEIKSDNRLENLRAMSIADHTNLHRKPAEYMDFVCPYCNRVFKIFARDYRRNQLVKGHAGPYCSRHCSGKVHHLHH